MAFQSHTSRNKYKVYFSDGVAPRENGETTRLYLRFKRYVFDKDAKKMVQ